MKIFITGTDTDVGKTLISTWLCLHTGYDYFKPIQTGCHIDSDSAAVAGLAQVPIHPNIYQYEEPVSPHLAAILAGDSIDLNKINLPVCENLIIEGAGGVLVPLNKKELMIDLIAQMAVPVILVARSTLGTINHTLLSLAALRARQIPVLGVILNGPINETNCQAIEFYGEVDVLDSMPKLTEVSRTSLLAKPLSDQLQKIVEP
jgi:dethiobiotin synthetase